VGLEMRVVVLGEFVAAELLVLQEFSRHLVPKGILNHGFCLACMCRGTQIPRGLVVVVLMFVVIAHAPNTIIKTTTTTITTGDCLGTSAPRH
jgi:hypothetical protein